MEIAPLHGIVFVCLLSVACGVVNAGEFPEYNFVAPVTIEQPGYYRLVNDVSQTPEGVCILINSSDVVIDGNGHTIGGKNFNYGVMAGPYVFSNVSITNLTIRDFAYGIHFFNVNNGSISNMNISFCGKYGIALSQCENVSVEANFVEHSGYDGPWGDLAGILLQEGSRNNTLKYNSLRENEDGIKIKWSSNNTIFNNEITFNHINGITLQRTESNIISKNTVSNNQQFGIKLVEFSDNNLVYDNYFLNSKNWEISNCGANIWNLSKEEGENIIHGPYIGGNFWGQPDGHGLSQISPYTEDGFCIAQAFIAPLNIDYLPLHYPLKIFPNWNKTPTDPDLDGMYEDINGNERVDFSDVVSYFNNMMWMRQNEPIEFFDYNGNNKIDFKDLVLLFNEVGNNF